MWVIKLKIKHDCTIGNRCKKFNCRSFSLSLSSWQDKKYFYTSQRHTIEGSEKNIKKFFKDLKRDRRIINLEISKNTVFFIEKGRHKIPSSFYGPKIFFVKPVYVDRGGYEYWELASWERKILTKFISELKMEKDVELKIEKFQNLKLDNIYFPKIMPKLTDKQKQAFLLAVENGYYKFPRKINLEKLAKLMNITISTLQEHLRKAEEKIMPTYK